MPKRKVLQTVIVYRDGARIKPAIGEIFDFKQAELESINKINPEAIGRPVMEVDVENQAAQEAAAQQAKAETSKKDEKADGAKKNTKDDKKSGAEDEV
ncbi:hypothetical protein [Salmonella phage ZCSE8]|nr:hypothetical protein [Salmonella phage ZCSE8]